MKKQKFQSPSRGPKTSNHKKLLVFVVVATIIAFMAIAYYVTRPKADLSDSEPVKTSGKEDAPAVNSKKEADIASGNITTESVPESDSFSLTSPLVSQQNGRVNASATINGVTSVSNGDKCVFLFEADGAKPVVRESNDINTTKCSISDIPEVEFDIIGTWNLKITLFANGKRAEVTRQAEIK